LDIVSGTAVEICGHLLVDRSDSEVGSQPPVQSAVSEEDQKSELKATAVLSAGSKVVVPDDKKQISSSSNNNNKSNNSNNGVSKLHQVEREGNCYW
jgi:hypothetical protein